MKYSKATDYALHTVAYLATKPEGETVGVREIAEAQKVSPTYLSKVLTMLVKAGFIESATGVKGGYRSTQDLKKLTFLEVIQAVEGTTPLFSCEMPHETADLHKNCRIQAILNAAEQKMNQHLGKQTIGHLISSQYHHSKHDQADKTAKIVAALESPERKATLPPEKFLAMLPLDRMSDLLDLGAGSGYLTFPAAKMTDGKVYALDINPTMLSILAERAKVNEIRNVEILKGSADQIPLPDEKVDAVMASLILHEVTSLDQVLQEISRILKTGGCFACIEFEKNTEAGPPMHIRISATEMEQAAQVNGFKIIRKEYLNDELYVLICEKAKK